MIPPRLNLLESAPNAATRTELHPYFEPEVLEQVLVLRQVQGAREDLQGMGVDVSVPEEDQALIARFDAVDSRMDQHTEAIAELTRIVGRLCAIIAGEG